MVTFGGTFPRLARHAQQMSIVRSFHHRNTDHVKAHVQVLTGGMDPTGERKTGFSMGSLFARLAGTNSPRTGMPNYSLLTTPEIDPQYRQELTRVRRGSWAGSLGSPYSPFEPGNKSAILENMSLNIPQGRFSDRRLLLSSLDQWKRRYAKIASVGGTSRFNDQAVDLLLGTGSGALDISREDPALVRRYDTSHIPVGFKKFKPSPLGKQMLMARRLCEAGCRFVTVHSPGWDMHADKNNPGMVTGMEMLGRTADQAVSTFLEDVAQRGLSKKIEDVKPCRETKRSKFYRMADIVRALIDGNKSAQPFEESRARKMAADADLAEIKAAMLSRDVIEVETVLRVWEQVVVALRQKVMHADGLDEAERREMLEDLQQVEIDEYFETGQQSVDDGHVDSDAA